jgi:hypothetical protein
LAFKKIHRIFIIKCKKSFFLTMVPLFIMKQPHYLALSAEKKDLATLHNPPDEPFNDLTRPPGELAH